MWYCQIMGCVTHLLSFYTHSLKWAHFAAPKAPQKNFEHFFEIWKFLSTFFEIFGKLLYRNAIESDFLVLLVDTSQNFGKNTPFWGKNTSTNFQKFWYTSTKVSTTPSQKIWLVDILTLAFSKIIVSINQAMNYSKIELW